VQLPELSCDHFELTDIHGGEKLGRFRFAPGEWVLADRGYSHRAGRPRCYDRREFIVRWNPPVFPLEDEEGQPFLRGLRCAASPRAKLANGQPGLFRRANGIGSGCARCAKEPWRRSALAQKPRPKHAATAAKKPDPQSLELASYVLVVTSVAPAACPARDVLELLPMPVAN